MTAGDKHSPSGRDSNRAALAPEAKTSSKQAAAVAQALMVLMLQ